MSHAAERHAVLAHWLAQKKSVEREREVARAELERWFKRAKLALDHGEVELARAAKERAEEAREAYQSVTARAVAIDVELERVRAESWRPDNSDFERAQRHAAHVAQEFAALHGDEGGGFESLDRLPNSMTPGSVSSESVTPDGIADDEAER